MFNRDLTNIVLFWKPKRFSQFFPYFFVGHEHALCGALAI